MAGWVKGCVAPILLSSIGIGGAFAEEQSAVATPSQRVSTGWIEGDQDPGNLLNQIEARREPRTGLIPFSPIQPFRDGFTAATDAIYEAVNLRLGMSFHTVGQYTTNNIQGKPRHGGATDMDIVGTWELFNRGQATQGELFFGVEGRWDYGPIGPQNLGFSSVGAAGGTANSFSAYKPPAFILRNLYYRMGSPDAGWAFRFGKITTDAMLQTNRHLTPNTTFLSNAGTGQFVAGYADSALGAAGAIYFADKRAYIAGLIADANGDRFDFGKIYKGDFYKAAEFGYKLFPRTDKASYSKFLVWHTDGTYDGSAINANTGSDGWGVAAVLSQELTADGKTVAVGRYGHSFDGAAIYDNQAALALLRYQPFGKYSFDDDVLGIQFNWVDSATAGTRDEYSIETFYRFPLLPDLDTSLNYQAVINPATTTEFDSAHVFSIRAVTSF
ncbi:MAG: carbohydrate porin [Roseibium sp.]